MMAELFAPDHVTGVSLNLLGEGNYCFYACGVHRRRTLLHLDHRMEEVSSIGELVKGLNKGEKIALNICGKGVLHKQLKNLAELSKHNFHLVIPNAVWEDFYVQQFISGEYSFVSLVRRKEVEHWLDEFKKAGFVILLLSLGPFPVSKVFEQLNVYGPELIFNGHVLERDEELSVIGYRFHHQSFAPFVLKVDAEEISEKLLLPYANAFQLLLCDVWEPVEVRQEGVITARHAVKRLRRLKRSGLLVVLVFFVLLLANTIVFTRLYTQNEQLARRAALSARNSEDLAAVKEGQRANEVLLTTIGWDGGISKSGLIDQIASHLPDGIQWEEALVNPVIRPQENQESVLTFAERSVRVSGTSAEIGPLNDWVQRLRQNKRFKKVELSSYRLDPESGTGRFVININY